MQNDVLKNNIAPWQAKGRWYNFTLANYGSGTSRGYRVSDDQAARLPFNISRLSERAISINYAGTNLLVSDIKIMPQTMFDPGWRTITQTLGFLSDGNLLSLTGLPELPTAAIPGTYKIDVWLYAVQMKNSSLQ